MKKTQAPETPTPYIQVLTPQANAGTASSLKIWEPPSRAFNAKPHATEEPASPAVNVPIADEGSSPSTAPNPNQSDGKVRFRELYRFATTMDLVVLICGCVFAAVNGLLFPCMALIYGHAISAFAPFDKSKVNEAALEFFVVACVLFLSDFLAYFCFAFSAERQVRSLREHALRHFLHLDMAWYDSHNVLQLTNRLTGDTLRMKDGMGQKLGDCVKFSAQFFAGYVIGFVQGWDIALAMCCVTPLTVLPLSYLLNLLRTRGARAQALLAEANAVAEETLASMRTISSLNGERRALDKFNAKNHIVEQENIAFFRKASVINGVFTGSTWAMYAVGLWYGGKKVYENEAAPGVVFSAFFGILLGTMSLGQISPNISAVGEAAGAAHALFEILDTPSRINAAHADKGITPVECHGDIQVRNLSFTYPSRPDQPVLKDFSLHIPGGQTVALVGTSGSGKSTLVSLLERFYDPTSGQLLLDGRELRTLNLRWLRSQIGLVSQQPVLFATTIAENIAMGLTDDSSRPRQATQIQIIAAACLANAHDFIMQLPDKYETVVGENGLALSGGQKQRIAIARALIREPKMLILDEATSALDTESELVVQEALNGLIEKTKNKMTTIIIAHRLSTVRHADTIVLLDAGTILEQGTHNDLMTIPDGIYHKLFTIQQLEAAVREPDGVTTVESREVLSPSLSIEHHNIEAISQQSVTDTNEAKTPTVPVKFTIKDAMEFSRPEFGHFRIGMFVAGLHGLAIPASALLISQLVALMTENYEGFQQTHDWSLLHDLRSHVQLYGSLYLAGAFALVAIHAVQIYCFRYMAEKLTARMRSLHFASLLQQKISFFDSHATGALTAELTMNAHKISLVTGDTLGRILGAIFTTVAAMVVAFTTGSWQLTLIMLVVFSLLLAGEGIRAKHTKGSATASKELADAGAHSSEALCNIRTIVSLGLESRSASTFSLLLAKPFINGIRQAKINGLAMGFSSFIMFATYALVFWYGGELVNKGDITFLQLLRTLMSVMMSAQGLGFMVAWLVESDDAFSAGADICTLRDQAILNSEESRGPLEVQKPLEGGIEFQNVSFRYPTRLQVSVLDNLSFNIEPGQTVAFCGASGGGKSTVLALIEQFYDPIGGRILLDGVNMKHLNKRWLRSQIGLVGQEPTLYLGTIAENIAYGLDIQPSAEALEEAARMANAHEFICQLPDGYETQVGFKGDQLSGGQRQRIAIARAIIKDPKLLLLDEATSALDSESEKVVQQALDTVVALKRRTTLIVAHRLSTIGQCDCIFVLNGGNVTEQGTHSELLAIKGMYSRLVQCSTTADNASMSLVSF